MRSLRIVCGVSHKNKCRRSDVRQRCGLKDVVTRVEKDTLWSLRYLKRMNEGTLAKMAVKEETNTKVVPCGDLRAFPFGIRATNFHSKCALTDSLAPELPPSLFPHERRVKLQ
ncbi:hypothetical protein EVAR_76790_1 [Eumeta japonica]|uniref:Uncharacterized protein n=1 Tax=Eumeta variegata TaxID=151549 RepID=A0A4C1ST69_EUMVA|nr:hypothetical protein EVAR_76790_1 [Eumeta japonica]